MTIKAIETEYNGYRFRSRLEARWAVFFDSAGIRYEYEPEGFELSFGRYLPDFYLPDYQVYVEIKPFDKSVVTLVGDGNEWEKKCDAFREETGKAILLCYDDPSKDVFKLLFAWDSTDGSAGLYEEEALFKQHDGHIYIVARDTRESRTVHISESFDTNENVITQWDFFYLDKFKKYRILKDAAANDFIDGVFDPKLEDKLNMAKRAARQARFEHGETPVVQNGRQ